MIPVRRETDVGLAAWTQSPQAGRQMIHTLSVVLFLVAMPGVPYVGCLGGSYLVSSTNVTGVPLDTRSATRSASQFVRRMQPCDSDLDTRPGNGVP